MCSHEACSCDEAYDQGFGSYTMTMREDLRDHWMLPLDHLLGVGTVLFISFAEYDDLPFS